MAKRPNPTYSPCGSAADYARARNSWNHLYLAPPGFVPMVDPEILHRALAEFGIGPLARYRTPRLTVTITMEGPAR